jgi:aclacinomycin oxidase
MAGVKRRSVLAAAALTGAAAGAAATPGVARAQESLPAGLPDPYGNAELPPAITPDDPRYSSLLRGDNHRFVGRPEAVRVAGSTAQVVAAVRHAVATGKRVVVRSGGHCWEDFTTAPDAQVLIDLSQMDAVGYDRHRRAFTVEPGATLGQAYDVLFKRWGVTFPGGDCPDVGVGGHIPGGGYGPLSRRYGTVADHLHAVEVVVVDRSGRVRAVVATRDHRDPNHDLWWAYTGGGGGNVGIATRYWLRTPGAQGSDPARLLPPAPSSFRVGTLIWPWEAVDRESFARIIDNHGRWYEQNSAPGSPYANLASWFVVPHRTGGALLYTAMMDDATPGAERLMTAHLRELTVGAEPMVRRQDRQPWLYWMTYPGGGKWGDRETRRYKAKSAYLRRRYSGRQIATMYEHLTSPHYANSRALMLLLSYGGQVGAVPPGATATAQRDSILKMICGASWREAAEDGVHLKWVRELYRDIYADTGGVPVPNDANDGAYINYADVDLADPTWNTSGVPWHQLYYKDNYPRLQQVKQRWDPLNVFRHGLSIQLPR